MSKTAIVIAHHHDNYDFLKRWVDAGELWAYSSEVHLIICLDRDEMIDPPEWLWKAVQVTVYDRNHIKEELGDNYWIIPTRTSAIKTFGFLKAYQGDYDYIITIDNDCFPETPLFIQKHIDILETKTTLGWQQTIESTYTRGFPYNIRDNSEILVNHGLWANIPDFDAPTQLLNPDKRLSSKQWSETVPKGNYFPSCGMNLAFKREAAPLMYFGLQGPDYPFDRFDDIWNGIFYKKVLDHLGYGVANGIPWIFHEKQSDVFTNLKKEAPGIEINEYFWKDIDKIGLSGTKTILEAATKIVDNYPSYKGYEDYFKKLKEAYYIWLSYFKDAK